MIRFGKHFKIVPLRTANLTFRRTIRELSSAIAVIGVHGGGFQNLMFMQKYVTLPTPFPQRYRSKSSLAQAINLN